MTAGLQDPFSGGHFVVEIDGIARSNFQSVSGLAGFALVSEYREGTDAGAPHKEIGGVDFANIELRAGLSSDRQIYEWWKTVSDGAPVRRNMSVVLSGRAGKELARWNVRAAVPVRYSVANLDSTESVVVEVIELAHEGIERA